MLCDGTGIHAGRYPKECRMGKPGGQAEDTISWTL